MFFQENFVIIFSELIFSLETKNLLDRNVIESKIDAYEKAILIHTYFYMTFLCIWNILLPKAWTIYLLTAVSLWKVSEYVQPIRRPAPDSKRSHQLQGGLPVDRGALQLSADRRLAPDLWRNINITKPRSNR